MDATFDEDTMLAEPEVGTNISFPTLSQIYSWSYQLNQIQSRFCNIMHSKDTILFRLDAILKVDSDLMVWKEALPTSCRPGNLILASENRYLHVLLMHLEYFNLLRAVHWAVIALRPPHAGTGDASAFPSRIRASERLCLDSARSFVKGLNE